MTWEADWMRSLQKMPRGRQTRTYPDAECPDCGTTQEVVPKYGYSGPRVIDLHEDEEGERCWGSNCPVTELDDYEDDYQRPARRRKMQKTGEWVPHMGTRGGMGARNMRTGETVYGPAAQSLISMGGGSRGAATTYEMGDESSEASGVIEGGPRDWATSEPTAQMAAQAGRNSTHGMGSGAARSVEDYPPGESVLDPKVDIDSPDFDPDVYDERRVPQLEGEETPLNAYDETSGREGSPFGEDPDYAPEEVFETILDDLGVESSYWDEIGQAFSNLKPDADPQGAWEALMETGYPLPEWMDVDPTNRRRFTEALQGMRGLQEPSISDSGTEKPYEEKGPHRRVPDDFELAEGVGASDSGGPFYYNNKRIADSRGELAEWYGNNRGYYPSLYVDQDNRGWPEERAFDVSAELAGHRAEQHDFDPDAAREMHLARRQRRATQKPDYSGLKRFKSSELDKMLSEVYKGNPGHQAPMMKAHPIKDAEEIKHPLGTPANPSAPQVYSHPSDKGPMKKPKEDEKYYEYPEDSDRMKDSAADDKITGSAPKGFFQRSFEQRLALLEKEDKLKEPGPDGPTAKRESEEEKRRKRTPGSAAVAGAEDIGHTVIGAGAPTTVSGAGAQAAAHQTLSALAGGRGEMRKGPEMALMAESGGGGGLSSMAGAAKKPLEIAGNVSNQLLGTAQSASDASKGPKRHAPDCQCDECREQIIEDKDLITKPHGKMFRDVIADVKRKFEANPSTYLQWAESPDEAAHMVAFIGKNYWSEYNGQCFGCFEVQKKLDSPVMFFEVMQKALGTGVIHEGALSARDFYIFKQEYDQLKKEAN